ncbi:hypothetical protein GCM10010266_06990 [Streptomyces griseomycini]|nr:hypothetical protein GCM10010266_06990 [Streptomyces griseomycini]
MYRGTYGTLPRDPDQDPDPAEADGRRAGGARPGSDGTGVVRPARPPGAPCGNPPPGRTAGRGGARALRSGCSGANDRGVTREGRGPAQHSGPAGGRILRPAPGREERATGIEPA